MKKIKVLYILGWGRSGSTLLGNILGQIEGFSFVGELRSFWDLGWQENTLCGCGAPIRDCDLWSAVYDSAFGGAAQFDIEEMATLRDTFRPREALARSIMFLRVPVIPKRMIPYQHNLLRLYKGIQHATNCEVIVDSSKHPSSAYLLQSLPEVEAFFIHLVRDSRAVAFSWQKRKAVKAGGHSEFLPQIDPMLSTAVWNSWNIAAELYRHRLPDHVVRVRYEDFIKNPLDVTQQIVNMVSETPRSLSFIQGTHIAIKKCHSVMGNPSRFTVGMVELNEDTEWKGALKAPDRLLVTLFSWLCLWYYRYL